MKENNMLTKIISGGQTGADEAGLLVARQLKLETGGSAPYNWMTDEGPQREYLRGFNLSPAPYDSRTYPKRTELNVRNSDGTVLFGRMSSPGSKLTIKLCKLAHKPYLINPNSRVLARFVEVNKIKTLNVAGNRERTNPGISETVFDKIWEAFK